MQGKILIVSGPSGVGKDTLIERWVQENPLVKRVVAYTTRTPREGEIDGVDYNFVAEPDFRAKAERGEFLEWKEVHGKLYGTPLDELESLVHSGRVAILKIDVQGGEEVMKKWPQTMTVFIMPPDEDELERRIRGRGLDSETSIQLRLANARHEMEARTLYQRVVINDQIENALRALEALID